jgi:hypothetical protein
MMIVQLAVGALVVRWWRTSAISSAAAACALLVLATGVGTWRFIGDAARSAAFLDVFALIALIAAMTGERAASAAAASDPAAYPGVRSDAR